MITIIKENKMITEKYLYESGKSKLKQILYGIFPKINTIGIITAENPMGAKFKSFENKIRNNNLEKSVSRYGFRHVKGQYGNKENSYIINNIDLDYLIKLVIKYQQESFIYAEKYEKNNQLGVIFYYYAQNWIKNFKSNEIDFCLSNVNELDKEFLLSYMKLNNGYYKLNNEFINILNKKENNEILTQEELIIISKFVNILDSFNIQIGNNIFNKISERKIFINMNSEEDFYTEYKGFKFQIPFFDDKFKDTEILSKNISYSKNNFNNDIYKEYKNESDKINKIIPINDNQSKVANRLAKFNLINKIESNINN